jgi:hypothetical protein
MNCCGEAILGLYRGGVLLGTAELGRMFNQHGRRNVHTDQVSLRKDHRRQGHGIPLYLALIRTAHKIGADGIYSSWNLNKFSKRMWDKKLSLLLKVQYRAGGCGHCRTGGRFYIRLK